MRVTVYELESPQVLSKKCTEIFPERCGEKEIFARTIYTAVSSGTESASWLGLPPLRPSTQYPRLMGYCNLARVEKVGSQVSEVRLGQLVLTHQSHREAFICRESDILLAFDESSVPEAALQKRLTATYLYHLGYSALLAAHFQPGHLVAIVGYGTLGVATASLLKAFGAEPFVFSNQPLSNSIRRYSKRYPESNFREKLFGMDGVDIVINTSNAWEDFLLSLQLARKGGVVTCLGFPGRGESLPSFNPLDSQFLYDKQLTIRHCGHSSELNAEPIDIRFSLRRNMKFLASLIITGRLDPSEILTCEVSWESLDGIYQSLAKREPNFYSAILRWN